MTEGLTSKQERFAQLVATGSSYSEAYRQSYDVSPDTLSVSVHQLASHLASNVNVASRIKELKQEIAERVTASQAWDLDRLIETAESNMELARQLKKIASANGALELIGRVTGLIGGKAGNEGVTVNKVTIVMGDREESFKINPPPVETEVRELEEGKGQE